MSDEILVGSQTDTAPGSQADAGRVGEAVSGNTALSSGDVGAEVQKLLQEKQRLEEDLRKVKSAGDKRIAQLEKAHKEEIQRLVNELNETKAELERLRELVLNDDTARKKYEDLRSQSEVEELRKKLAEYEQRAQEEEVKQRWISFFSQLGVNVSPEGDLDEIARQGWEGVQRELEALRAKVQSITAKSSTSPENETPEASQKPTPRTDTPSASASKITWNELVKRYGSEERVFRMVELGLLPPDILPL